LVKAVELGKNAEEIKQIFAIEKQKNNGNAIGFLRGGIIVSGIGIGLAAIGLIVGMQWVYASSAFILILGLALIAIYYLTKPKGKTK
jgi:lipoprotein signal peptidase